MGFAKRILTSMVSLAAYSSLLVPYSDRRLGVIKGAMSRYLFPSSCMR